MSALGYFEACSAIGCLRLAGDGENTNMGNLILRISQYGTFSPSLNPSFAQIVISPGRIGAPLGMLTPHLNRRTDISQRFGR